MWGILNIFSIDPPLGVAHWMWSLLPQSESGSRWPGWDFGPGSSRGVELHWGTSSQLGHGISIGPVVVGVRAVYHFTVSPPDRKRVILVGNVGSPPSSSSIWKVTCFLGFYSVGVGALLCCTLLLDSWVLACSFKSCIYRHSHSPRGLDLGGLGDDNEDCLWHFGEVLWHHLDLLLLFDGECHCHDPDCPVGEPSLGHLVASLAHGSTEEEWVHEAEQPQEGFLLFEDLIELGAPCRPALAICQLNSWCSSLMQSLCCWWKSMPVAKVHSPW